MKRRHEMTEIDGGFCSKLNSLAIGNTRLDEGENISNNNDLISRFIKTTRPLQNQGGGVVTFNTWKDQHIMQLL